MADKPELSALAYHEMLDRIWVVSQVLDEHLQQHPVSKLDKEIAALIETAGDALGEAYQVTGRKRFELEDNE